MGYLVCNPPSKITGFIDYRIFSSKPQRVKEPIMDIDYDGKLIDDHYGNFHYPLKETGKYSEFWAVVKNPSGISDVFKYDRGVPVNPSNVATCLQDITWQDEPKLV